jgi:hypothetical protein
LNDERGLLLCSWPRGKRPALPFVYSDEVWTGIEYQVAAHLIYEDMVKEGLAIVDAVRDRYDGARRNPWNEIECGHHYARAMSSWSLVTALSGFSYSAPEKTIRFRPRTAADGFRSLFSAGTAWGVYSQQRAGQSLQAEISVEGGSLELARIRVPWPGKAPKVTAPVEAAADYEDGEAVIRPKTLVKMVAGDKLAIKIG